MSMYEFCIVCGACCGLAVLRFGVPAAIMWMVSTISHRVSHVS